MEVPERRWGHRLGCRQDTEQAGQVLLASGAWYTDIHFLLHKSDVLST